MSRASVFRLAGQLARQLIISESPLYFSGSASVAAARTAPTVPQLTSLRNWAPAAAFRTSCIPQQEAAASVPADASPTKPQVNNPPSPPWTPTKDLNKRKTYTKRMGFMMQVLEKETEEKLALERKHPHFTPGDVLQLKLVVPENKRRPAIFKGVCIARRNKGVRTTFRLRNYLGTAGGVERSFPLYSPNILEIQVLESRKSKRSKLYFLRDRQPKEYRV